MKTDRSDRPAGRPNRPGLAPRRLVLAGLVLSGLTLMALVLRPTPAGVDPPAQYLFLLVSENNNAVWAGRPEAVATGGRPSPSFDPDSRSLALADAAQAPAADTRVLVWHEAYGLGEGLGSRVYRISRLPGVVPLSDPWQVKGRRADGRTGNVVGNPGRTLPAVFRLEELWSDGTLLLNVGGEEVRLGPDQGWQKAWIRTPGGVKTLSDGPDWRPGMMAALRAGQAVTVLSVYNHGFWAGSDVRVRGR